MADSTRFPLWLHAGSGQWAKKIKGRTFYFGTDRDAALARYVSEREDLEAGRTPRPKVEGLLIRDLCNRYLTTQFRKTESGELAQRSFLDNKRTCDLIIEQFGKSRSVEDLHAEDFEQLKASLAATRSLGTLGNEITRVRGVFNYAWKNDLIDRPVKFGSVFSKPSKKALRRADREKQEKLFTTDELKKVIGTAGHPLKAMILLGINCGFGNADCGHLTRDSIRGRWVDFPRPKTGEQRRCYLWEETAEAIQLATACRPAPKEPILGRYVFLTKQGNMWAKETADNPITKETRKLLGRLNIHRRGIGFYTLRHTFRTIADETRDQPAVNLVMGHADTSMAAAYRERISNDRLVAVSRYVHQWLFG